MEQSEFKISKCVGVFWMTILSRSRPDKAWHEVIFDPFLWIGLLGDFLRIVVSPFWFAGQVGRNSSFA